MKKLLKTMLALAVICCIAVSGTVFADVNDNYAEESSARTMYYLSGSLNFTRQTGKVSVNVTTSAFEYIDKIYHDVTIYKNGSLYSSQRYSNTNCQSYTSLIKVPAVSGDYFEVYVDHYTSHDGVTESDSQSRTFVY